MNRRLLVDLEALTANYRHFQAADDGAVVGAVVKANAYGLGAGPVAQGLEAAGCRMFFVATAGEGADLRRVLGPGPDIFVFDGVQTETASDLVAASLTPVINDAAQLALWQEHTRNPVAAHFDTGMKRLGFDWSTGADALGDHPVSLLLTHLACADEPDHPLNRIQVERFAAIKSRFPGVPTSIGNSAGCLTRAETRGDVSRPGIGLYGGNPFADADSPVRPVASLQGRVLQLKTVAEGESVGYGATWTAGQDSQIAVVALGYADGLPRALSGRGELAIRGERCPLLGRVSMDYCVADVSRVPAVESGDWAEAFGNVIGVDEVAAQAGTIAYEMFTGVGSRVTRVYYPSGS
jgi:alanine racemase